MAIRGEYDLRKDSSLDAGDAEQRGLCPGLPRDTPLDVLRRLTAWTVLRKQVTFQAGETPKRGEEERRRQLGVSGVQVCLATEGFGEGKKWGNEGRGTGQVRKAILHRAVASFCRSLSQVVKNAPGLLMSFQGCTDAQ